MNRKKFIASCGVIGTAAVIAPSVAGANILSASGDKKIKVAIIGCGSVSGVYLPHLSKSPYVELVSVCDIKQKGRKNVPKNSKSLTSILTSISFWPELLSIL